MTKDLPTHLPPRSRWERWVDFCLSRTNQVIFGFVLVTLALIGTVTGTIYNLDLQELRDGQDRYYRAFTSANEQRVEAARLDRQAIRAFLIEISRPDSTESSRATALQNYLSALDGADNRRAANPLPDSDSCRGGDGGR